MAAFFANGEIKNYCRQCGRVEVSWEGKVCAGCLNSHKGDPKPGWYSVYGDFLWWCAFILALTLFGWTCIK